MPCTSTSLRCWQGGGYTLDPRFLNQMMTCIPRRSYLALRLHQLIPQTQGVHIQRQNKWNYCVRRPWQQARVSPAVLTLVASVVDVCGTTCSLELQHFVGDFIVNTAGTLRHFCSGSGTREPDAGPYTGFRFSLTLSQNLLKVPTAQTQRCPSQAGDDCVRP